MTSCAIRRLVVAAVLLLALGGCGTHPVTSRTAPVSGAAGDFAGPVNIGNGRHLYLECHGQGGATIVLESGYHDSSDPWSLTDAAAPAVGPAVLPALAGDYRVCAYDRPGALRYTNPPSVTDRSSPVAMPRTAQDVVGDLHELLATARVPGPYVLVAHSLGGLFARLYAQTYPDQMRAMVFVDAFAVEIPTLMGSDWPAYRQLLNEPLPQFASSSSFEVIDIDKSVAQVAAGHQFPPIPIVVLTKTQPFPFPAAAPPGLAAKVEQTWQQAASNVVALRPQTPHLFATGSDHYIQVHQPDLVAASVGLVVKRSAASR
ncbi:alpha/beta hydrolase [Mycobacterium simiae]|uniref:Alpha/beta hydrolase n=1 Tax=Mycobacterium simiae TaxID=1784 RepID=A0A5B1BG42_MYCSI|nr:alpha/beta hydrolase [Mycobacterium simiae]KAA1247396.1 alpha/beta hydrolase [Mycobacterium simiae]